MAGRMAGWMNTPRCGWRVVFCRLLSIEPREQKGEKDSTVQTLDVIAGVNAGK